MGIGGVDTKQLIKQAFIELSRDTPLADITVQDIAARAGVSVRTFYNHFGDKYEFVRWMYDYVVEARSKAVEVDGHADFRAFLALNAKSFLTVFAPCDRGLAVDSHDRYSHWSIGYESMYRYYSAYIEKALGRMPDEGLLFALEYFIRACNSAFFEWYLDPKGRSASDLADLCCDWLMPEPLREFLLVRTEA